MGRPARRVYLRRMSNASPKVTARMLRHGERADDITEEAGSLRARELALIDGREARENSEDDRARALAELRGQLLPEGSFDDGEVDQGLSRDPAEPRSITGAQTPMQNDPEDQEMEERLALEGVEEAQHDQMLAARRAER
jgi:hypothetical protein